jgi:hypothetical protein
MGRRSEGAATSVVLGVWRVRRGVKTRSEFDGEKRLGFLVRCYVHAPDD